MTDTPTWFTDAVSVIPEDRRVEVDGAEIHYLSWGDPGRPGIVFVHGGAAHAHWWSHIAPAFLASHSVAAVDLSGHGDSDRRDQYSLDQWCDEVAAVIRDAAFDGPPLLVGHSMGGFVTVATAARHASLLAGAVIIDSPVIEIDPEVRQARASETFNKEREYDEPDGPIARFRAVPGQDVYLPYVKQHIAERSLRQDPDGKWRWKFDSSIFMPARKDAAELLPHVTCRVALLRCEHGLVTRDIGEYMYEQLGRVAPVIELPTAGHHPMLDVPLILITAIRSLIADWDHSRPLRRS
ncbi:MAG: alpha/beta hydrolase [Acidimicrobiales bacterium]|nr:alpha/beta hydrolase [Acidimicrobiales bacterium]